MTAGGNAFRSGDVFCARDLLSPRVAVAPCRGQALQAVSDGDSSAFVHLRTVDGQRVVYEVGGDLAARRWAAPGPAGLAPPVFTDLRRRGDMLVALSETGQVFVQGRADFGALGLGPVTESEFLTQLRQTEATTQVSCGAQHTLALDRRGNVFAWGAGFQGQLGRGREEASPWPAYLRLRPAEPALARRTAPRISVIPPTPPSVPVVLLHAAHNHSLALLEDGRVLAWGENLLGQLGFPDASLFVPTAVPGLPAIRALAASSAHTLLLSASGEVFASGSNSHGQSGAEVGPDGAGRVCRLRFWRWTVDREGRALPPFSRIFATAAASFCCTADGQIYYSTKQGLCAYMPRPNEEDLELVFANKNVLVFFRGANIRGFFPRIFPAGLSARAAFCGSALSHTGRQSLRVVAPDGSSAEHLLEFCEDTGSLAANIFVPQEGPAQLAFTLDGLSYRGIVPPLHVYPADLHLAAVEPVLFRQGSDEPVRVVLSQALGAPPDTLQQAVVRLKTQSAATELPLVRESPDTLCVGASSWISALDPSLLPLEVQVAVSLNGQHEITSAKSFRVFSTHAHRLLTACTLQGNIEVEFEVQGLPDVEVAAVRLADHPGQRLPVARAGATLYRFHHPPLAPGLGHSALELSPDGRNWEPLGRLAVLSPRFFQLAPVERMRKDETREGYRAAQFAPREPAPSAAQAEEEAVPSALQGVQEEGALIALNGAGFPALGGACNVVFCTAEQCTPAAAFVQNDQRVVIEVPPITASEQPCVALARISLSFNGNLECIEVNADVAVGLFPAGASAEEKRAFYAAEAKKPAAKR